MNLAATLPSIVADDSLANTITLLQSRYHSNERENMMGIKERSSYEQERARITHGLLTLLDDVENPRTSYFSCCSSCFSI
ncbi:MAG: hypothetical protein R2795_26095 [Saprospiraceae bacterium]